MHLSKLVLQHSNPTLRCRGTDNAQNMDLGRAAKSANTNTHNTPPHRDLRVAQNTRNVGQLWPSYAKLRANVAKVRPNAGHIAPRLDKCHPRLAEVGPSSANVGKIRHVGPMCPQVGLRFPLASATPGHKCSEFGRAGTEYRSNSLRRCLA